MSQLVAAAAPSEASIEVDKVITKVDGVEPVNVANGFARTQIEERFPGRGPLFHGAFGMLNYGERTVT